MKIENIGRAHELIEQREKLLNIIDKLESEEITFVDECGKEFETPAECVVEKIADIYKGMVAMLDEELESL